MFKRYLIRFEGGEWVPGLYSIVQTAGPELRVDSLIIGLTCTKVDFNKKSALELAELIQIPSHLLTFKKRQLTNIRLEGAVASYVVGVEQGLMF